jgi:hypothetical protein
MQAAKRAILQQEARDRAELLATLRAAKEDASDNAPQPSKKVNMFDEFRNPEDL